MCLGEIKDREWSEAEMKEIFDAIDEDGSGEVSLKEFMACKNITSTNFMFKNEIILFYRKCSSLMF